jgi:manganese/iron transport system ATP-binding protein
LNTAATSESPLFFRHVTHAPEKPALDVDGLRVHYQDRLVLEDVSCTLQAGERLAVVGPNGAGKSTLFKAVAGLLAPSQGDIRVFGSPPRRHACIAYVVQRSQVDWTFPVNVADVVMMGRVREIGLWHHATGRDRQFVRQCLDLVGLADLADRQIGQLSGGQQQRMFIARALAQQAEIMLMDEPFTGLDLATQEGILAILERLSTRRVTVLVATHDLNLAAEHFDRVMLLNRRLIGCGPPADVFTPERLMETFGGHARSIRTREGLLVVSDSCCSGGPHDRPPG